MINYVPVIMTNGSLSVYAVQEGRTPTLEWLQKQVCGPIEIVPVCLSGNLKMIVNEEGLLEELPLNSTATDLYRGYSKIVGHAVVMKAEGCDLVPLTPDELKLIAAFCASCRGVETRKVEPDNDT
jgi:hypothetical protein